MADGQRLRDLGARPSRRLAVAGLMVKVTALLPDKPCRTQKSSIQTASSPAGSQISRSPTSSGPCAGHVRRSSRGQDAGPADPPARAGSTLRPRRHACRAAPTPLGCEVCGQPFRRALLTCPAPDASELSVLLCTARPVHPARCMPSATRANSASAAGGRHRTAQAASEAGPCAGGLAEWSAWATGR